MAEKKEELEEWESEEEEAAEEASCKDRTNSFCHWLCIDNGEEDEEEDKEDVPEEVKLGKSTLDACIVAVHHFSACDINGSDIFGFAIAFLLHIFALSLKLLLPALIKIFSVNRNLVKLSEPLCSEIMFNVKTALAAPNIHDPYDINSLSDVWISTVQACGQQPHDDAVNKMMLFVWFAFLIPALIDMWEQVEALYCLPWEPEEEEHDPKAVSSVMNPLKDKDKSDEDKTSLKLSSTGAKCENKPKEKKDKKCGDGPWGKNWLADYNKPKEDKQVGVQITYMGVCPKLFIFLVLMVPDFLCYLYVAWVGIMFIVFEANIAVLIIKALIMKAVLKIPAKVMKALGSNYLKKYAAASQFKVVLPKHLGGQIEVYRKLWLGPMIKMLFALALTFFFITVVFYKLHDLRTLCGVAMERLCIEDPSLSYCEDTVACPADNLINNTCTKAALIAGMF